MLAQLIWGARRMGAAVRLDARSRARLPRIIAACALMGGALYGGAQVLQPWLFDQGLRYGALAGLIGLGVISYFGSGAALGAFKLSDFRALRQR
ncbi:MAG: lipid II flippase MurJ, partial [Cypionkella sp.]